MPEPMSRTLSRAAMWTGAFAAASGAVLGAIVGLLCWLPDAGVAGHPVSAVKAGVLGFLASQHGGLTLDGVSTGLAPLLGVAVVAVLGWRAGTTLAEVAGQLGADSRRALIGAAVVQALTYALACLVLVPFSALGATSAQPVTTAAAAFGLFGAVAVTALLRARQAVTLPSHVLAGVRGAAAALGGYIAAGALLVAGSLVMHAGLATQMSRQVGGGISGVPILVLGILCTPNAAVAGAAYLAGPGFTVGSGATFTPFAAGHGLLPAFPLLAALPSRGANAVVVAWTVVTLVGAGVLAARVAGRDEGVRGVAVAAGAAGLGMAVLAWLGGGALGSGRLHTIGASPWQSGLAVAGEIAVVALAYLGVRWLRQWLAARDEALPPEPELVDSTSAP